MQIFFTSDLHVDVRVGMSGTRQAASWLEQRATPSDVLVLGGDYGNTQEDANRCLKLFSGFPGRVCAILGNHDIWFSKPESLDTRQRINAFADAFTELGYHWLDKGAFVKEGVAIVGSMGWYDYSFKDPSLGFGDDIYRTKRLNSFEPCFYRDGDFVNWNTTDTKVVERQCVKMRAQLDCLSGNEEVSHVFAALHHCPTEELLRPRFVPVWAKCLVIPKKWRLLHAFAGAQRFSDLFQQYRKVKRVACGHIHLSRRRRIGHQDYLSCGSTYNQKEVRFFDPKHGSVKRKTFS